ncbi:MAG: hypothetical protein IJI97_10500 [Clostridia bacterium]|nr:hypothetical protein [Clostridia bacterium]
MQIDSQGQLGLFEDSPAYDAFEAKFVQAKTTDDCYTPENVFEAVADWTAAEYGLDPACFVRPFWPGGDYLRFDYPEGCVVVDNPPFSIRAQIIDFYLRRGIRFLLFSPALTLLTQRPVCHIAVGVTITYENGARVPTSFVTNLEPWALRTAPALYEAVQSADKANQAAKKKTLPKYEYPDHIVTAALAQRWCRYGVAYRLAREDCVMVGALDAQRAQKKSIFGEGFLLSERAAAERAAAERWQLSAREMRIVAELGSRTEETA